MLSLTRSLFRVFLFPTIRTVLVAAAVLISSATGALAQNAESQQPITVVVAPFAGDADLLNARTMMAVNVTRALNAIPGVYAPGVGEATLLAGRAEQRGVDQARALIQRFNADHLLVGNIQANGRNFSMVLQTAASDFEEDTSFEVSGASYAELADAVIVEIAERLLPDTPDVALTNARKVAADWPGDDALGTVARSAARLSAESPEDLNLASTANPDVAVVYAELARASSLAGIHDEALRHATTAVELLPGDPTLWTLKAAVETRADDVDAARNSLAQAITLNPSYGEALQAIAALVPPAEAVQFARLAVNVNPRLLDAQLLIANAETGARSLSRLRQIGYHIPEAVFIHERIVAIALEAGDVTGAIDYVRETARDRLAISPALFETLLNVPDDAVERALPVLEQAVAAFPDSANVMRTAARLLRRAGMAETAVDVIIERFGDRLEQAPQLANELALALLSLGRDQEARNLLTSAAESSLDVRYNLALAYLESGRPRAAADTVRSDINPEQEDASVWSLYALARLRSGNLDEAEASAMRALRIDASNTEAQAVVQAVEDAREAGFTRPLNVDPEVRSLLELGLTRLEQSRHAEAVDALQEAYEQIGGDPFIAYHLGSALQRAGFPSDAVTYFEEALVASNGSPQVRNNLGFAWLQSGRFDRALEVFKALVEDAPEFARAHLNLALTYRALGLEAQAEASLDTALALDPSIGSGGVSATASNEPSNTPPDGDETVLQVGAFADRQAAQAAITRLTELGFVVREIQEDGLLKLTVGPFPDTTIETVQQRLRDAGFESFAR